MATAATTRAAMPRRVGVLNMPPGSGGTAKWRTGHPQRAGKTCSEVERCGRGCGRLALLDREKRLHPERLVVRNRAPHPVAAGHELQLEIEVGTRLHERRAVCPRPADPAEPHVV